MQLIKRFFITAIVTVGIILLADIFVQADLFAYFKLTPSNRGVILAVGIIAGIISLLPAFSYYMYPESDTEVQK